MLGRQKVEVFLTTPLDPVLSLTLSQRFFPLSGAIEHELTPLVRSRTMRKANRSLTHIAPSRLESPWFSNHVSVRKFQSLTTFESDSAARARR